MCYEMNCKYEHQRTGDCILSIRINSQYPYDAACMKHERDELFMWDNDEVGRECEEDKEDDAE